MLVDMRADMAGRKLPGAGCRATDLPARVPDILAQV